MSLFIRTFVISNLITLCLFAGEPVDLDIANKIRHEAFNNSRVMNMATHLSDQIGPRLTGSPQMKQAVTWTRDQFKSFGMDAEIHGWGPMIKGWTFENCHIQMVSPRSVTLNGLPGAWSPGIEEPTRAEIMRIRVTEKAHMEPLKGKLAGKYVLIETDMQDTHWHEPFTRYSEEDLAELAKFPLEDGPSFDFYKMVMLRFQLLQFLKKEGALALFTRSSRDTGIIRVTRGGVPFRGMESNTVPMLALASKDFNLIDRLLDEKRTVELRVGLKTSLHQDEPKNYNTIATMKGSDLADEVVMAGAHLDSWHIGTGATDNGGSVAVCMEAVRILKAINAKTRRTIKVGLWGGEEQGLLGSSFWVMDNLADYEKPAQMPPASFMPPMRQEGRGEVVPKRPAYDNFSAYFNLDNGSGKIRGIYTQENVSAAPIFKAWLAPFNDLGATTVSNRNTNFTDHIPFDSMGLPGFQFIQDPMNYTSQTHHSNLDVVDFLVEEDLKQSAAVLASFLYHAANRDEKLPRK